MKFSLTFKPGVTTEAEFPDDNFLFSAAPIETGSIPDQIKIITDSLDNPIGIGRLEDILSKGMKIVILIDDITRPTPTAKIIPFILQKIHSTGIGREDVKIIMAPGTHRPATEEELEIKLGREIMNTYQVLNRNYLDESKFVELGETKSGIPIALDREVTEADFVIGIGNIIPHISAGWSGGGKLILPGVCSRRTTDMMHYTACVVQPVLEILGTCDNIPRKEIEEIAGKAGLKFIINTVLDENFNIQGVFSGDYIKAHRKGVELAEKLMIVPIPRKADILIVSANPCHFDFWQGIKPYAYSHRAVRDGGVIIYMLDGEEHLSGDAPTHEPTLRKYTLWSFEDMKKEVETGVAEDIVGLNVPMYYATLRHRVRNFLVTNHLTRDEIDAIGFEDFPSVQAALDEAFSIMGRDAKVGIIPYGGETLTRVNPEEYAELLKKSALTNPCEKAC